MLIDTVELSENPHEMCLIFSTKVKKNKKEAFIHWLLSAIGQNHHASNCSGHGGLVSAVSHVRGRKGGRKMLDGILLLRDDLQIDACTKLITAATPGL